MKRKTIVVVILGVVVLLVFAGLRQVFKSRADLPKSISQLQDERGVPVEVMEVTRGTFTLSRTYMGTIEGALQGDAVASIMEKIVAIPVSVGDRVRKGDVVCRLDTKASMARYNQLKLAYDDARREAERMERLYAAGAVSKQILEKAELNRDISKQNLESSSEVVALTAPIPGVVTEVFYRPGETTQMGEPVVRIADLSRVKIKFSVNYDDWKRIAGDTPIFLRLNGDGLQEIPGRISDISMSADPGNRLFSIWVEAENAERSFQPGLLVDIRVVVVQKPDVTLIPRDAVLTRNDQLGVFVVQDDRRAVFTPLETGDENTSAIEVVSGLQPGQIVVVYGQNNLSDGQLVNIVKS